MGSDSIIFFNLQVFIFLYTWSVTNGFVKQEIFKYNEWFDSLFCCMRAKLGCKSVY